MHGARLAAPLVAVCLVCAAAHAHDTGHDAGHDKGHAAKPAAEAEVAGGTDARGGTVVERTLGDGPPQTMVVTQGTDVRLVLRAPAGVELHLHGYDLSGMASGDAPVVMTFRAEHPGRFAIEAHGVEDLLGRAHRALAYVEVRPE